MGFASGIEEAGRLDFDRLRSSRDRLRGSGGGATSDALPSFLGQVVTVESKLKVGTFCKVLPAVVLGNEVENGPGGATSFDQTSAATTAATYVALLGSFVPRPGDYLVCRFVDHRWVAETTGGGVAHGTGVLLPQCFCSVPATLRMVSGDPSCNYGMFQSCTIAYGPPPPAMVAFGATANLFTSTELFHDPITDSDFFYYFSCQYNQFFLSRIFPTSPLGSPYRDGFLYNWIVGGYGNRCDPFELEVGLPFPGSDATCSVMIFGS